MTKSKTPSSFEYESIQDSETIVKYLDALARGFESNRLLFCAGKKELILKPVGLLGFSVKVKRKDGQVKVDLRISWKESGREESTSEPLVIRSDPGGG
jgi:amphi-Trp domain-containing protein